MQTYTQTNNPELITTGTRFISTKLFCSQFKPDAARLRKRPLRTFRALAPTVLLKLSSFIRRGGQYIIHISDCWKFIQVLLCQIL